MWRQDTSRAAEPKAKWSRGGLRWALAGIVVQHLTVARVAEGLGVAWNTANEAVLAEGKRLLIDAPARFDDVTTIGVDDHVWRHTHRGGIEVVAMDGFTGFKTSAAKEVPDAVAAMEPFHVVRLAGDALDQCRHRVQLAIHDHPGFKDDPLYKTRRTLHTGVGLLTERQCNRLRALFADEAHVEVEAS